jgi:hypothetical protein
MTGDELIDRFERGEIPADAFHHSDHVQLAFAYLNQYPVLEALEKFVSVLKRFASAIGKPQLYNETITFAYFFLIRERMASSHSLTTTWEEFCHQNPDLIVWKEGILSRYYNQDTLKSDLARSVFLFPDKKCVNKLQPS